MNVRIAERGSRLDDAAEDADALVGDEGQSCLFCGEREFVTLREIWGREFMLDTCCEWLHDATVDYLNEVGPREGGAYLESLGAGHCAGTKVRRVIEHMGQFLLDWNLSVHPIRQRDAKDFVTRHHRHNRAPAGWRFGAAIRNGMQTIGVVMVGRPVARMLNPKTTVEVNRCCFRTDVPRDVLWNGCSLAYGWAAREARRRKFQRIVTYTRIDEAGTSLIAAGWEVDGKTKGRHWDAPSRRREKCGDAIDKVRWSKWLGPARPMRAA